MESSPWHIFLCPVCFLTKHNSCKNHMHKTNDYMVKDKSIVLEVLSMSFSKMSSAYNGSMSAQNNTCLLIKYPVIQGLCRLYLNGVIRTTLS